MSQRKRSAISLSILVSSLIMAAVLVAQVRRPSPIDQTDLNVELARLAITDPVNFNAELDKLKTDADRAAEALAWMALTNPDEYHARYAPKDAARRQAEADAARAFAHPILPSPSDQTEAASESTSAPAPTSPTASGN